MKKLELSYSNIADYKWKTLADIKQAKKNKNYTGIYTLTDGTCIESLGDGRYKTDDNRYFEEVIVWDDVEEIGFGIGFIEL